MLHLFNIIHYCAVESELYNVFLILWACSRCMPLWNLRSEFRVVMSVTISARKRGSVRLYLHLFVDGIMSYLRYLCLFAHSGVQHILWCVFIFLVYPMLPVYLDCPFMIVPLVFSNLYLLDFIRKSCLKCCIIFFSRFDALNNNCKTILFWGRLHCMIKLNCRIIILLNFCCG